MSDVRLTAPEVSGQTATFHWQVEPATSLYRATEFSLELPDSIDLGRVPKALWWRIALICLHSQWALLGARRVVLPVTLAPGEAAFWERMSAAQGVTLAARAGEAPSPPPELVEAGPPLPPMPTLSGDGPPALCFSGGRDSLVHLGLLCELGLAPLLVATTSPRDGSAEHITPRRSHVLAEGARRRDIELIEVRSNLRSTWDNGFASRFCLAVNEVTDCFLYMAAALVVAAARSCRGVVMASEFEVQAARRVAGGIAQHGHFMYSAATQRSLSRVLEPTGLAISGLSSSLEQFQLQRLLLRRFADLSDLQYSCWELREGQGACSRCDECRNNGLTVLADGLDPAHIQIDLAELLAAHADWAPGEPPTSFDEHLLRSLQRIDRAFVQDLLARADGERSGTALTAFDALVSRAREHAPPPEPGYRAGYLAHVEKGLRPDLTAIIAEHFEPEPPDRYRESLELGHVLSDWIAGPLDRTPAAAQDTIPVTSIDPRPPNPGPLGESELDPIRHLIPAPEPRLAAPAGEQQIPVSGTLLDGNERRYLEECLATNRVSSQGAFVGRFEDAFAAAVGAHGGQLRARSSACDRRARRRRCAS